MIKVLIVDDSATVREFLAEVLGRDPGIQVIGRVKDGWEAIQFLEREKPDVITMDIEMPKLDGFEATRKIMETNPVPVVIVSGQSLEEQRASFRAFEAGALAVVSRPPGSGHEDFDRAVRELANTIKAMAEVKVVRRWPRDREVERSTTPLLVGEQERGTRIVGIGASTGGPAALKAILSSLPADFPYPVIVVQHMTRGFLKGFADWLGPASGKRVRMAENGDIVKPGEIYVAPEGRQIGVESDGRVVLVGPKETLAHCPSVSWLFRSLADSFGPAAVAILLTGMGRDGADEMKLLRDRGAITIVQSGDSCIVNGMPDAAVKLDAASYVLSPERIGAMLRKLAKEKGFSQPQDQEP